MKPTEQQQIKTIIENITNQSRQIPFLQDLLDHAIFGPSIATLSVSDHAQIKEMINQYLEEWLNKKKTKGADYFKRLLQVDADLFWQFRSLNEQKKQGSVDDSLFQSVGKEIEQKIFFYEGKLTERMFKQEKGLDKVIDSFYNLVYAVFPYYNDIE